MTRTLTAAAAAVVLATGDPAPAPAEAAASGLCEAYCVVIKTACDASIGRWYQEGCDALHAGCMVGCSAGD